MAQKVKKKSEVVVFYDLEWAAGNIVQVGAVGLKDEEKFTRNVMPDTGQISFTVTKLTNLAVRVDQESGEKKMFNTRLGTFVPFSPAKEALVDFLQWLGEIKKNKRLVMISYGSSDIHVLLNNMRKQGLEEELLAMIDHFKDARVGVKSSFPQTASNNLRGLVVNLLGPTYVSDNHDPLADSIALRDAMKKLSGEKFDSKAFHYFQCKFMLESSQVGKIIGKKGSTINGLKEKLSGIYLEFDNYGEGEKTCRSEQTVFLVGGRSVNEVHSAIDHLLNLLSKTPGLEKSIRLLVEEEVARSIFRTGGVLNDRAAKINVEPLCCPFSSEKVINFKGEKKSLMPAIGKVLVLSETMGVPGGGCRRPFDTSNL